MKLMLLIIMLMLSLEICAARNENINFCNQVSEYAHNVMELRQNGVQLSDQLELSATITENSSLSEDVINSILTLNRKMIYKAYTQKIHKTQELKNKAAIDFKRMNLNICLKNIR